MYIDLSPNIKFKDCFQIDVFIKDFVDDEYFTQIVQVFKRLKDNFCNKSIPVHTSIELFNALVYSLRLTLVRNLYHFTLHTIYVLIEDLISTVLARFFSSLKCLLRAIYPFLLRIDFFQYKNIKLLILSRRNKKY